MRLRQAAVDVLWDPSREKVRVAVQARVEAARQQAAERQEARAAARSQAEAVRQRAAERRAARPSWGRLSALVILLGLLLAGFFRVPLCLAALRIPMPEVREAVVSGLRELAGRGYPLLLRDVFGQGDAAVRREMTRALLNDGRGTDLLVWHIGPYAVEPLVAALKDADERVREEAAGALERIGTPEAQAALRASRQEPKPQAAGEDRPAGS